MESFTGQVIWSQARVLNGKKGTYRGEGCVMDECSLYIYEALKNYVHHLFANEIRSGLYFHKSYTC